jgi:hypothetical protein
MKDGACGILSFKIKQMKDERQFMRSGRIKTRYEKGSNE